MHHCVHGRKKVIQFRTWPQAQHREGQAGQGQAQHGVQVSQRPLLQLQRTLGYRLTQTRSDFHTLLGCNSSPLIQQQAQHKRHDLVTLRSQGTHFGGQRPDNAASTAVVVLGRRGDLCDDHGRGHVDLL